MEFFEKYFSSMNQLNNGEFAVCCPFPHTDQSSGATYKETNPSAHINPDKDVFHCKVCGTSHSEASFLAHIQGISYTKAVGFLEVISEAKDLGWSNFQKNLKESHETLAFVESLGLTSVIDTLELGYRGDGLAFPVKVYGEILDVRTYSPENNPKVKSEKGTSTLILPFDLWMNDDRPTILCAGEKDMAIARVNGFNSITFTGGEGAFPKLFKHSFKGKKVYVAYDNDMSGREGSLKVCTLLMEAGAETHLVDLSTVCTEKGEDIHDYFQKYHRTADDLQQLLDSTPIFSDADYQSTRNELYPLVNLQDATKGIYNKRLISSRVVTIVEFEQVFEIPDFVSFQKADKATDSCSLDPGWSATWSLDDDNVKDILKLCDGNLVEAQINASIKGFVHCSPKEKFITMQVRSRRPVFKCVVSDDLEKEVVTLDSYKPAEMTCYSFEKLKAGGKYRIFFKRYPHPSRGAELVAVVLKVEESDSSINKFQLTDVVKESLKVFQTDNVKEKMNEFAEQAKAICGIETPKQIAWFIDLFFHTPLQFDFGDRRERAYLDVMLVGETRTAKSQTAKKMIEMYELGVITSLKTATIAGLIGGSDNTGGGFKTKLGILPRNHKGAVIMEEFSGGGKDVIKKLTEIRSSNTVRITRVNGTTNAPAMVRMLAISNPATRSDGQSIPLDQYPHGIKVLLDLVGAAEDIARYDLFLTVGEPTTYINPMDKPTMEAFPKESYMNRVRWSWSRKPEQVIIEESVRHYIMESSFSLNEKYNTQVKLFGSEAWKKLSRLAIAVAALVCSTNDTFENIVVKNEHVQWAKNFMIACYDNELFKLKEYAQNVRLYTQCSPAAVSAMQGLYNQHATLITQMDMNTEMSINQLKSISGLSNDDFNAVINTLAECYFIHYSDKIMPSRRFKKALAQINKSNYLKKVGAE